MRGLRLLAAVACVTMGIGCQKAQSFKPLHPLPVGSLQIHFTNKVEGPVDLIIDDIRIPVLRNKKRVRNLIVQGLSVGHHRYFISSPRDAFGPDHGEVDLPQASGIFLVNFSQTYNAVLYGTAELEEAAQGIPGVSARMEP